MNPPRGLLYWGGADGLVAAITAAGLEPVAVLNTTPDWALAPADRTGADRAASNGLAPPAEFADFARFAAAFAQRYGDRIRSVSYTHLRAHETVLDLVCRLLLEKKKQIHRTRNIVPRSYY